MKKKTTATKVKKTASVKSASVETTSQVAPAKPTKAKASAPVEPEVQGRISARAHELWIQRGCLDGYHMEDWLQAECEVLGQSPTADRSSIRR